MVYEAPFCVIWGVTVPPHEPELEHRLTASEAGVLVAVHSPTISSPGLKLEPAEGLIHVTSCASEPALASKATMRSVKQVDCTIRKLY